MTAHHRVFALFFLYSFGLGGMFPRLGEIQRGMGATEGALGLALTGTAVGTLLSLSFAGRLLQRWPHRSALGVLLPLVPVFYGCASLASAPWVMFLCLLPGGLCIGMVEVIVNLEADRVEHALGRRIMNRAHAFWSIGFFAAGAVGALAARFGLSPQAHLWLLMPLFCAACFGVLRHFQAAAPRPDAHGGDSPHFATPTLAVMALVVVSLSALLLEGAGAEWSAIYMRDVFASPAYVGGVAVAVGAAAQAVARLGADRFVERHGPARVARTLLALLGAGAALVLTAPHPALALAGFALMGVGTSAVFPLAVSAAAQRTDRPAALNVAALAQFAFGAFLLGPPLLGLVAQHLGVRWSFGIALPLVLLSFLFAGALASRGKG